MNALSPEAYAVIEGRHSDPFHYLGRHVENNESVVRVYLPDAKEVKVVDDQGHESELRRIHDAGLFAGRMANGSQRYHVRARFGEQVVELEDPYRFPPVCPTSTSFCSAKAPIFASMTSSAPIRWCSMA